MFLLYDTSELSLNEFGKNTDKCYKSWRCKRPYIWKMTLRDYMSSKEEGRGIVSIEEVGIGGRIENIQTTALLRSPSILRRVLKTWGDLLPIVLQWKTISLRWCEKLALTIININIYNIIYYITSIPFSWVINKYDDGILFWWCQRNKNTFWQ